MNNEISFLSDSWHRLKRGDTLWIESELFPYPPFEEHKITITKASDRTKLIPSCTRVIREPEGESMRVKISYTFTELGSYVCEVEHYDPSGSTNGRYDWRRGIIVIVKEKDDVEMTDVCD